jgi:quinol monooxygenase YgiN
MAHLVVAHWQARPDTVGEIEEILAELSATAEREEPGCLSFRVFRNLEHRNRFLLVEEYRDAEAFQAHLATEHFARLVTGRALEILDNRYRVEYEPL